VMHMTETIKELIAIFAMYAFVVVFCVVVWILNNSD